MSTQLAASIDPTKVEAFATKVGLDLAVAYNGGVAIFRGSRRGISLKGAKGIRYDAVGVEPGTPEGGPNPGVPQIGRPGSSG